MKKTIHSKLNTKSTWTIDSQLAHILRAAHTLSPNHVKSYCCQGSLAMAPEEMSSWWPLSLEPGRQAGKMTN